MLRAILLFPVVLFLQVANGAPATSPAAAPSGQLLAHGTDEIYWIARVEPSRLEPHELRTSIQMRSNASQRWREISRLEGRAVSLANRADDLVVLLDSGQWMLLWPGGGSVGQPLPNDATLLAVAGTDRELWALGRGPIATVERMASSTQSTQLATQPATQLATQPLRYGLALFQWDERRWVPRVLLDEMLLSGGVDSVSMILSAGAPVVALRDEANRVHVIRIDQNSIIRSPGSVSAHGAFKLINAAGRPMLWIGSPQTAGALVPADRLTDAPKLMASPSQLRAQDPRTLVQATGQMRLVFVQNDRLFEQAYTNAGELTGQAVALGSVEPLNVDALPTWIGVALLVMLTFFVFGPARRPATDLPRVGSRLNAGDEPNPSARSEGLSIAPMRLRLQAGVLDALPVIAAIIFITAQMRGQELPDMIESAQRFWPLDVAALGVYFLHTTLSELFSNGRTLGKWLFGLRVVTTEGVRPGVLAIIVRNVARVLEVWLFLPLFVAFFTSLHQRIGDLAAATVVVVDRKRDEKEEKP